MAVTDEPLGSVRIVITGDQSELARSLASAQTNAAKAGQQIAVTFSGVVGGAAKAATGMVDQFGRAVEAAAGATEAATAKDRGWAAAKKVIAAQNSELIKQDEQRNRVYEEQYRKIQALAMIQRVYQAAQEGNKGAKSFLKESSSDGPESVVGAIPFLGRAAERFVSMIPGMGEALLAAFPVFGAIALGSSLVALAKDAIDVKSAEEAMSQATRKADSDFASLTKTVDRLNISAQSRQFGKASGLKLESDLSKQDMAAAQTEARSLGVQLEHLKQIYSGFNPVYMLPYFGVQQFKANQDQIRAAAQGVEGATARAKTAAAQSKDIDDQLAKQTLQDAAAIGQQRIQMKIRQMEAEAGLARKKVETDSAAAHGAAAAAIEAIQEPHMRAVAMAELDVKTATDKADAIFAIEEAAATKKKAMLQQERGIVGAGEDAVTAARARLAVDQEIADTRNALKNAELDQYAAVTEAENRLDITRQQNVREIGQQYRDEIQKNFSALEKGWHEATARGSDQIEHELGGKNRAAEIQERSKGNVKAIGIQGQIEEKHGDLEIGAKTMQQRLAIMRQIKDLERQADDARIDGLTKQLEVARAIIDPAQREVEVARIGAQIEEEKAQSKIQQLRIQNQINQAAYQGSLRSKVEHIGASIPGRLGGALAEGAFDKHPGRAIGAEVRGALKGIGKELLGTVLTSALRELAIKLGVAAAAQALVGAIFGTTGSALTIATTANATATAANAISSTALAATNAVLTGALVANTIALWAVAATNMFGFADGGEPPTGRPSIVGEKGPELFIPHQAGKIIPNHMMARVGVQKPFVPEAAAMPFIQPSGSSSMSSSSSMGDMNFHIHGNRSPRETTRQIANYMRSSSAKFQTRG
jgi:hypothetical protein